MHDVEILVGSAVRDRYGRTGRLVAADQARVRLEMFDARAQREEVVVRRGNSAIDTTYEILTTEGWKSLGTLAGKEDSLFRLINELEEQVLNESPFDPHKNQKVNKDGPRGDTNIEADVRWKCSCRKGDPIECKCKKGKKIKMVRIPLSYKADYNPDYRHWKSLSDKEKGQARALAKKVGAIKGTKVYPLTAHVNRKSLLKLVAKHAAKAGKGAGKKKMSVLAAAKAKGKAKRGGKAA